MEKEIGIITNYFENIHVAIVKLTGSLKVNDRIHIVGSETDFEQFVNEIQIDKKNVEEVSNADIGLKVEEPVRKKDKIFLVTI